MMGGLFLRTALVQGRLAFATRRAAAARANEVGLQILTPPQLAARLAGGLIRPASRESIETGIRAALAEPGKLQELGPASEMPGMTRALMRTLGNIWRSGYALRSSPYSDKQRIRDLIAVENTIRDHLEPGELLLPDLCDLARQEVRSAPMLIGPLSIEGVHAIDPIWHPLIDDLRAVGGVTWHAPAAANAGWFDGDIREIVPTQALSRAVSCADPAHEMLEAMRWVRALLASGEAKPSEIAIATVTTSTRDDYVTSLAAASALPISFVGGRPALASRDGQRCAALADVLQHGLGQARVRRLLSVASKHRTSLEALPQTPLPVASEASLSSLADWTRALATHEAFASILLPVLGVLARGTDAATEAADLLLRGQARAIWDEALRRAPASALQFTLPTLRIPEERDLAGAVAWCSAEQLAAAPRPFVWLLGLTAASWPRATALDPILPSYVIPPRLIDPDPVDAADQRCLDIITQSARQVVLSTTRLNAQGTRESPSPLMPTVASADMLHRERHPDQALTEADRLVGRPKDAANDPSVSRALAGFRNWRRSSLTPHDGWIGRPQSLLSSLLTQPQSPTSLSLLLRDPLAYIWYYALGWRDLVHKERGLILSADDFGRLVHEILKRAVDHLEPRPGFTSAAVHEKEEAIALASGHIIDDWPQHTNVPPPVLWLSTVRRAAAMCLSALTFEPFTESGTRSWTEVPFGGVERDPVSPIDLPWDHKVPVVLPGTDIRIYGIIDRLDLTSGAGAVRVNDYKTGQRRKKPSEMILAGGAELQRAMYALACRTLLCETRRLASRLIYLREPIGLFKLPDSDAAIDLLTRWTVAARAMLEAGTVYPGTKPYRDDPRFGRLAMPADAEAYQERKREAAVTAAGVDLSQFWGQP